MAFFNLVLTVALVFVSPGAWAQVDENIVDGNQDPEAGRFIVKIKKGESENPFTNNIIQEANLEYLAEELSERDLATRELPKLGLVVTEGDQYDVEDTLADHPLIEYFEVERKWDMASLNSVDLPSEIDISPWLRDVLGFSTNRPDPEQPKGAGAAVIVAVIDTGLSRNHPYIVSALATNAAESSGAPGVDDDGNGYVDDVYGANVFNRNGNVSENGTDHGSHVAGIVKTIRDQSIASYPQAKQVQVLPIRFIDDRGYGTTTGAVMAMEYAAMRGARVVNTSWGALGSAAFSRALYDSVVELYNRDILVLSAAGNAIGGQTNNNDSVPYFPASFNIPAMMSVGSLTPVYRNNAFQRIEYSTFANYGPSTVHVAAPGSFQESQYFDYGILSMNAQYTSQFDYFVKKKGTSMATPVVAGIAAVARAINPSLTNYEVRNLIFNNSIPHSAMTPVASGGYVHAINTYTAAASAVSQGERPGVALPLYYASSDGNGQRHLASASASGDGGGASGGGGCGMIRDISSDDHNKPGPFGGNSIIMVTTIYLLQFMLRKLRKSWLRRPFSAA